MSYQSKYTGAEIDGLLDKAGTALQEHQDISHLADKKTLDDAIEEMFTIIGSHNREVKFFCIEPVTVKVGNIEYDFDANTVATAFIGDLDFEIIPTSNKIIKLFEPSSI